MFSKDDKDFYFQLNLASPKYFPKSFSKNNDRIDIVKSDFSGSFGEVF